MTKLSGLAILVVAVLSLCWSVYRDIQLEKLYPGDLRNRIVGARLQKDGKMPYFYKWKPADGIRYYDPQNFDSLRVSTSTASPFFHMLLYPIADLQQRTISRLWVFVQYLLLFAMVGMALTFAATVVQKMLVMLIAASFLFTEAWINLIAPGQLYLFIPFLAMLVYFFLRRKNQLTAALLAGLSAVSLFLIRPNTVLMFIPFLFLAGSYSRKYIIAFLVPVFLMLAWVAGNPYQRALWTEYAQGLSEQVKLHQDMGPTIQQNEKDPVFASWEGWNTAEIEKANASTSYINYSENGNVFVLARDVLGIHLSPKLLMIASFSIIFIITLVFYFWSRKSDFAIYNLAILGVCLYMISDLFSPVYRHQYYTVQWFYPLLLAAAGYTKRYNRIYIFIISGLILNIINSPYIKMEHTLGEYIIFAALLLLAFMYKQAKPYSNHIYPNYQNL
ncbi:MAG TPA: glycosyltransferase family 87 protein [Agriterribacter sp.]|nr:glycosyltransferase family 87 protein [Agriterribacter sp.]